MIVNLHPNVSSLVGLAAKGDHRFALQGVLVKSSGGNYRCEATDGRVLGVLQGENTGPWPERPLEDARFQAIIATADWKNTFKGIKEKERVSVITEEAAPKLVLIRGTATMLVEEMIGGKWPNTQQVMPIRSPSFSVAVDPHLLIELLKVAGGVIDDETKRVTLAFYPNKDFTGGLLGVVAKNNTTGQVFDGILVPLEPASPVRVARPHETNGKAKGGAA